jgi:hypothetical protein
VLGLTTVPVQSDATDARDDRRRARAAARAADRLIPPQKDDAFSHLALEHLRTYRQWLVGEEDTISYWRRLLQARLDLVRAGDNLNPIDPAQLRSILAGDRIHQSRTSVISVVGGGDVPELPDLRRLWATSPTDEAGRQRHEAELAVAEAELSTYRGTLHQRLDAATAELIARYHENPSACLVALPLPPDER